MSIFVESETKFTWYLRKRKRQSLKRTSVGEIILSIGSLYATFFDVVFTSLSSCIFTHRKYISREFLAPAPHTTTHHPKVVLRFPRQARRESMQLQKRRKRNIHFLSFSYLAYHFTTCLPRQSQIVVGVCITAIYLFQF